MIARSASAPIVIAPFRGATELAGSWWPDWHRWVSGLARETVEAREPGAGGLPAIEDAPGSYVKLIATD